MAPAQLTESYGVSNLRQHTVRPIQQFPPQFPTSVPFQPIHTLTGTLHFNSLNVQDKLWAPQDELLLKDAVRRGLLLDDVVNLKFSQSFSQNELSRRYNIAQYQAQKYATYTPLFAYITLSDTTRQQLAKELISPKRRAFTLLDGQRMTPGKRYKISESGFVLFHTEA